MSEAEQGSADEHDLLVLFWRTPATLSILGLLIFIYLAELLAAALPVEGLLAPAIPDLARFGASNSDLILWVGQWWRMFTAPLLHANLLHIALNGFVLWISGRFVETRLGTPVLLLTLSLGGVAGEYMSMHVLGSNVFGVGASGAIMALVAVAAATAYVLFADDEERTHRGRQMANVLVFSLIPRDSGVDYGAHFGGAIAGGLIALVLCTIPGIDPRGRSARLLCGFSAGGYAACALYGAVCLTQLPSHDQLSLDRIPDEQAALLPTLPLDQLHALLVEHPGDPRPAEYAALAELKAGHADAALRTAQNGLLIARLSDDPKYSGNVVRRLRATIALAKVEANLASQADPTIVDTCADAQPDPLLSEAMHHARICL